MSLAVKAANPWLHISPPKAQARLRLICLPYAGGAASIYRTWHQYLPADIEVCAAQLPGRENRIREAPFTNLLELVQALLLNLLPYLDEPFALFGHSMGALIAYELAQQLSRRHGRTANYLFVSGKRAPFLPDRDAWLHTLPSEQVFLEGLQRRYKNIPAVLFEDAELRELFVPVLRADLTLTETYKCIAPTPLPCPIVAFGGESDSNVSPAELQDWKALTQSTFRLHLFPGDHFYLNAQVQRLLSTIAGYLA